MIAALVFASSLAPSTGFAQNQSGKESPKALSLTGCLVKGDEPREVWLAETNGTIYWLETSKIEVNAYLGHKVIVTGHLLPEGKEKADEEEKKQNKTSKRETADFRVLTLKVIKANCTQ